MTRMFWDTMFWDTPYFLFSDWSQLCCVQWSIEDKLWPYGQVQYRGGRVDGSDHAGLHVGAETGHQGHA